jgi:TRAP-type transport system periplasmic protein
MPARGRSRGAIVANPGELPTYNCGACKAQETGCLIASNVRFFATLLAVACAAASAAQASGSATAKPAVEVTVAGTSFRGTTGERHWLEFQRDAERASQGSLKMRMLIRGELGSEEQIVSGLRRGRVQFANLSALVASTVVPETALLYAPYLATNVAEADYVLDRYLTPEYTRLLAARGLQFITWYDLGFQQIWSRKKPLLLPSDAKGVRFRVSASKSAELLGRALRADLIPLGFADIIPSLQTGLIEAGENAITLYARTGTAPEAPHLTITDHSMSQSIIVADKRWWDRLSAEHRRILLQSFPSAATIRTAIRAEQERDLAQAAQLRFKVYRLTPAQKAAWVAATRDTPAELARSIGGESARLLAGIESARRDFARNRGVAARDVPAAPQAAAASASLPVGPAR